MIRVASPARLRAPGDDAEQFPARACSKIVSATDVAQPSHAKRTPAPMPDLRHAERIRRAPAASRSLVRGPRHRPSRGAAPANAWTVQCAEARAALIARIGSHIVVGRGRASDSPSIATKGVNPYFA